MIKVAILADAMEYGAMSIKNYIRNILECIIKKLSDKIEDEFRIVIIHHGNVLYPDNPYINEIIIPFPRKIKSRNIAAMGMLYGSKVAYNFLRNTLIRRLLRRHRVDLLHIPHLSGAEAPSLAFIGDRRLIVTLHGVSPLVVPPRIHYEGWKYVRYIQARIDALKWRMFFSKYVKFIITVSESAKRNIARTLNIPLNHIYVVYHGVDHETFKPMDKETAREFVRAKYGVNYDFILHASLYQPKKNVKRIIKAFLLLKKRYRAKEKLVILGKQPRSLIMAIHRLGLSSDIVFVGYVPYKDLPIFYNVAKLFVFPSLHESFGMPILEAMACGCPVITSNTYACPEVGGDAAITVNPYDVNELAKAIYQVLTHDDLRDKISKKSIKRAKKFTWENAAKKHIDVYIQAYQFLKEHGH